MLSCAYKLIKSCLSDFYISNESINMQFHIFFFGNNAILRLLGGIYLEHKIGEKEAEALCSKTGAESGEKGRNDLCK